VHGPIQSCLDLRLVAVAYGFDKQIPKRSSSELNLAEDVEHLTAQRLARFGELIEQLAIDIALAGFLSNQVPQVANLCLSDPVNPSKPLLDSVRVPWQVVVDHQVCALKVNSL